MSRLPMKLPREDATQFMHDDGGFRFWWGTKIAVAVLFTKLSYSTSLGSRLLMFALLAFPSKTNSEINFPVPGAFWIPAKISSASCVCDDYDFYCTPTGMT